MDQYRLKQLKMCQLLEKGLMEEIDHRSSKPTVICSKCGARANLSEQVHNPTPIRKNQNDHLWS